MERPLALAACAILAILFAACGGENRAPEFVLNDDRGAPWSLDAQDRSVVLLFGYTHCSDTCPLMLAKLSQAIDESSARKRYVEVAFVTVDPRRDTPAVLHAYLKHYGENFRGLNGNDRADRRRRTLLPRMGAEASG